MQSTLSFYTIEADSLASPSKKPSHLQKRFRTRSNKSVESTTKKAKDILDNRRQKLALRSDAIKAKLKSIKESRVLETENQMKKITIGLEEATTKREELLKVKVESNASIVERAKTIARTQNQKSREEMAVIQKNLEKRMRTTSNRRARNLLVPKSRLLDAKTRRESLVVNDEAAVCIQDWWRERKFTPLVKIYRKVAVTKLKAKELNFSGLMARVQNPTTLKATSFLIIRAKRTVGIKYNWKQPARVLLLAYVIALYPQEMFTEMNVQEQDLISLAAQCITELEHYVNATSPEVIAPLARSFLPVFADFYTAFEAWKKKDSKKVISELVDHFMELDQLWISVCENENAMLEWGPNIDQHQKMHLTRLKRYGDGAVQLLLDARQQLKASFEEAGTELKIARNVVPTASATVYYVTSNRDSVKRIDSVLDGTEIVNEQVQKPTAQDMDMFGQLLSNEQLAHEIAMDPSFKLQPAAKSELQQRVEKQAKQAFADALDREIDVQVYDKKCLVIIKDISQGLLSLLNENGAVHGEISEVLNHEFLVHQIKNKVFELHKVTHYIVSKMLQLCAPVRDAEIRLIENSSSMGAALVNILDMIQVLKLDMANFRLETIKPFLKNEAIGFEHKKFKEALENKNVKLENTRVWLERAFEQLKNTVEQRNPEQIENLELKFKFSRVLDQAYLSLLFSPTAIDPSTLPETLKLDASRLFSFQNELQAVAVTAAVVHLAQNLVPVLKRESLVLKQLAKNMFRLLNESTTNLETISGLIVDTANQVLHQQSKQMAELSNLTSNPTAQKLVELPQEKITLVHSMVEKTLSLKDPFLNVICRRIEKITRLYLEDEGKKRGFASNGLGIVEQELETLLKKIGMVTKYNRNVYGEYYDQLLSQLK